MSVLFASIPVSLTLTESQLLQTKRALAVNNVLSLAILVLNGRFKRSDTTLENKLIVAFPKLKSKLNADTKRSSDRQGFCLEVPWLETSNLGDPLQPYRRR